MVRRLNALKDFFDAQCEELGLDQWASWCLPWAKRIAHGERLVFNVSPLSTSDDSVGKGYASEDAAVLSKLRKLGLAIEADDSEAIARGERQLKNWIDTRIADAVSKAVDEVRNGSTNEFDSQLADRLQGNVPDDPSKIETRTFHQAIQAYRRNVEKTGKRRDGGKLARSPENYIRWSRIIERTHDDFPMWKLDKVKLDELLAYWRNRPVSEKTGTNISYDDAKHKLDCLWSIVVWVDENDRWKWRRPKGKFKKRPERLDQDRKKNRTRRVSKNTYSPDQLALIVEHLDTFEKMILAVCVNCGMQPAEIGRLETDDFFTVHPETEESGDWVIMDRPKTGEYGEWILWPEVAALLKWGIERANRLGSSLIIVDEKGRPWYVEDWSNPETNFGKWWQEKQTKKNRHEGVATRLSRTIDGFPRLTLKTLRKILPNLARPKFGKEIADLLNARKLDKSGNRGGRDTDRYSDRLYEEANQAILELETVMRPFLDALRKDEVVSRILDNPSTDSKGELRLKVLNRTCGKSAPN